MAASPSIAELRARIAAVEAATRREGERLAFGVEAIDACLPGGGLALAAWHELAGQGLEAETAVAPAAFAARLTARLARQGEVVWVLRRDDLYPPGLAGLGFPAQRLILVRTRSEAEALAVLEEALGASGVCAAIGEVEAPSLVAGRRLQLACERGGGLGLVIRRRPFGGKAGRSLNDDEAGSAAASRWHVAPALSDPGDIPGLGPARWRAELWRCRGGRPGAWILQADETQDAPHPFHLVADLADRGLAAQDQRQSA